MDIFFEGIPEKIKQKILEKAHRKKVAFCEGFDERIIAASKILTKKLDIKCLLLSDKMAQKSQEYTQRNIQENCNANRCSIPKEIDTLSKDCAYLAGTMLSLNEVDAAIGGCVYTTAHMLKAALHTVRLKKEKGILCSAFLLSLAKPTPGGENLILFSDCAVIPTPSSEQLTEIASHATRAFERWTQNEPRVSFLSFSTLESAKHEQTRRVKQAYEQFHTSFPDTLAQGEIQFDAAVSPAVASRKAPNTMIQGKTNVFIFPDLNSGNICYKMMQYIAEAKAWGPILLGTQKPFSDLSRGATCEDIVHSTLLTLALGED